MDGHQFTGSSRRILAWRRAPRSCRRSSPASRTRRSRTLFTPEFILCASTSTGSRSTWSCASSARLELEDPARRRRPCRGSSQRRATRPARRSPLSWFLRKLAAEGYVEASPRKAARLPSPRSASAGRSRPRGGRCRARSILARSPPSRSSARWSSTCPSSCAERRPAKRSSSRRRGCRSGSTTSPTTICSTRSTTGWEPRRWRARSPRPAGHDRRDRRRLGLGGARRRGERLARDAGARRIGRYVFTEIVPTFLRRAERSLEGAFPGLPVEFRRLDMDRDFVEQGVERGMRRPRLRRQHGPRRAGPRARRSRGSGGRLRPGGAAVFSECVRPFEGQPIYVEFVFNFLENFTGVATDPATRPNHGFLTPENWRRAFAAAGFERPGDPPRRREPGPPLRRLLRGRGHGAQARFSGLRRCLVRVARPAEAAGEGSSQNG